MNDFGAWQERKEQMEMERASDRQKDTRYILTLKQSKESGKKGAIASAKVR